MLIAAALPVTAPGAVGPVTANDDFILILDQSGSMREKVPGRPEMGYEPVENRLSAHKAKGAADAITFAAREMLRTGDHLTLMTFGDKAAVFLSQQIGYAHERDVISRHIRGLLFNDRKTDISDSLVQAAELIGSLKTPERRKIMIMITDGVNDPPPDSPYIAPDTQKKVYAQLRDRIQADKWNVFLVGLGKETAENIYEIARNLGLSAAHAKIVEHIQNSREVADKLTEIFRWAQEARVETEKKFIRLKLKPAIFGGYEQGADTLTLLSFYGGETEIKLDPNLPLRVTGCEGLRLAVNPLNLTLSPREPGKLNLCVSFSGKRPEDGRLSGHYAFQFSPSGTRFYPHEGSIEIILTNWWEIYGFCTLVSVMFIAILISLILRMIRRIQVPEIRVIVTAGEIPLGQAMTLRRKEKFVIANQYFEGLSVSAKGLSCKIAAHVRYLGRGKFEAQAAEAKIFDEGKELERLQFGMNRFFDLKDKEGNRLRMISINKPAAGDPFGAGTRNDPF